MLHVRIFWFIFYSYFLSLSSECFISAFAYSENYNDTHSRTLNSEKGLLKAEISDVELENSKPVLRKCCHYGETLTKAGCVIEESGGIPFHPVIYHGIRTPLDVSLSLEDFFNIEFGDRCKYGRYRLEPSVEPMDEFYLLDNGSLWLPAIPATLAGTEEFCMEAFWDDEGGYNETIALPLVCFPQPDENEVLDDDLTSILFPVGLLLSVPFLLLTLATHILIPELRRNLQGKCFMCHVISLTFAYLGLASIQLSKSMLPTNVCVTIAFTVQFAFIACFSWLNVMCFDIWKNIRLASYSSAEMQSKALKRKMFIWYSIYAWSFPILIIAVSMVMDLTPSIPSSYIKPQFGVSSCWFLSEGAALPYFYGPIGIMIFANVVLFVLSARRIILDNKHNNCPRLREQSHAANLRKHNKTIKLCFTLFVLMGVNWTMEIISWASGNKGGKILKHVWYVTDVCNSLQGVFIFIIFILDSGVRALLKKKFIRWGCCNCCIDTDDEIDLKKDPCATKNSLLLS